MDYRKLHDDMTEVLAQGLHYEENVDRLNTMLTAAEVSALSRGGIDRYMTDYIYRRKVQSLVARLMQVVEQNNHATEKTQP